MSKKSAKTSTLLPAPSAGVIRIAAESIQIDFDFSSTRKVRIKSSDGAVVVRMSGSRIRKAHFRLPSLSAGAKNKSNERKNEDEAQNELLQSSNPKESG